MLNLNEMVGEQRIGFVNLGIGDITIGYSNDANIAPSWGDGGDEGWTAGVMIAYGDGDGGFFSVSNAMFTGVALDRVGPTSMIGPHSGRDVYVMSGANEGIGDYSMNRSVYTLRHHGYGGLDISLDYLHDGYAQHLVHHIKNIPTFEYDPSNFGNFGLQFGLGSGVGEDPCD